MKKIILLALFFSAIFLGCGGDKEGDVVGGLKEANGGRFYGGVFNVNESEYIRSLFPHSIFDVYSYRVASQIYEGLVKFDQDSLTLIESLAEYYELDETRTIYTFKLKEDVYFHDDECFEGGKGRKLTAEDVKYSFTLACTQSRTNSSFNGLFQDVVVGANEYYEATQGGQTPNFDIEGFKVIDERTFQITLTEPKSTFLYNLARPGAFVFPKEAYEKYGQDMRIKCVGTGPFRLSSVDEDNSIILKKFNNYYGVDVYGNELPFLDAINIKFLKDKKIELLEFKQGNLDMMYRLPTDYIIDILDGTSGNGESSYSQYELQREPEMSTSSLLFNNQSPVFKDVNVRKAFSFAIDREKILDYVLSGEGYLEGFHGFTPPTFLPKYDIYQIKGYSHNVDSANYYLSKAGYPNGNNFPKIQLDLNSEGERFTNVALEVKKQLSEVLNIDVEINISTFAQISEKSNTGNYALLRVSWIADYPNPESYLAAFYSKHVPTNPEGEAYPNLSRYSNSEFDKHYEMGLKAETEEQAFEAFMKAEQIMMDEAPVLVLWYDEAYRLLQPYIKNFPNNPIQYRDFSQVYKVPTQPANTTN